MICSVVRTATNLILLWFILLLPPALANTPEADFISLTEAVLLTHDERAFIKSLPRLKVATYPQAPPLSLLNEHTGELEGISVDIFRFIAEQLHLSYELIDSSKLSGTDVLSHVKSGQVDVFMPLSIQLDRLQYGLFTEGYFNDYYTAITRANSPVKITHLEQLSEYQIGVSNKVSILPYLESFIPKQQLHEYGDDILFEALRRKEVDVAIYLQRVFEQKQFRSELFDLEKQYVLHEAPRAYSFIFSPSVQHQRLIEIINRFIHVIDSSASIQRHTKGEQLLIKRYVAQQERHQQLIIAIIVVSSLLLLALFAYFSRQRRVNKLALSHTALSKANRKLEYVSSCDILTNLPNRRAFTQCLMLEHALHQRTGAPLSVLIISMDVINTISARYGHGVADTYLQKVAATLSTSILRSPDLIARYTEAEFALVLPSTDQVGALAVAKRIQEAVLTIKIDGEQSAFEPTPVSIGSATLATTRHHPANALLAEAGQQLYLAKHQSLNHISSITLEESPE